MSTADFSQPCFFLLLLFMDSSINVCMHVHIISLYYAFPFYANILLIFLSKEQLLFFFFFSVVYNTYFFNLFRKHNFLVNMKMVFSEKTNFLNKELYAFFFISFPLLCVCFFPFDVHKLLFPPAIARSWNHVSYS